MPKFIALTEVATVGKNVVRELDIVYINVNQIVAIRTSYITDEHKATFIKMVDNYIYVKESLEEVMNKVL